MDRMSESAMRARVTVKATMLVRVSMGVALDDRLKDLGSRAISLARINLQSLSPETADSIEIEGKAKINSIELEAKPAAPPVAPTPAQGVAGETRVSPPRGKWGFIASAQSVTDELGGAHRVVLRGQIVQDAFDPTAPQSCELVLQGHDGHLQAERFVGPRPAVAPGEFERMRVPTRFRVLVEELGEGEES